jgi:hypothetical protein
MAGRQLAAGTQRILRERPYEAVQQNSKYRWLHARGLEPVLNNL